jgi:group I intron endonuclease
MAEIYKTTNLLNGKIYIGQSYKDDEKYLGSGKFLKRAIKKYGIENFKKEILEKCSPDKNTLDEREKYWINHYKSTDKKIGYNISIGGQSGWMSGLHHSSITKEKISESGRKEKNHFYGKHHTDITKEKISQSLKKSEKFQLSSSNKERRQKISEAMSKRVVSEETKKKLSEAQKGRKKTNEQKEKMREIGNKLKPFLGCKHTEESKRKISQGNKGKIMPQKAKEKLREINTGKKLSDETKQKISKSLEKKVEQYNINGELLNTWNSSFEAGKILNISFKKVRYYCRKNNIMNKYGLIYKNANE